MRLSKAAKELNVGTQTLIDFLEKYVGDSVKNCSPMTQITDEQWTLLSQVFHKDKLTKDISNIERQVRQQKRESIAESFKILTDMNSGVLINLFISSLMNITEKSKNYAEGKALESITNAIAQAYEDGYRQGYMDCEAKMPKDLIGEDKVEYIDLGLPSGTLWGISDKSGKCYGEVKHLNLPTIEQLKELKTYTSPFFVVDYYNDYGNWKQLQYLALRSIENGAQLKIYPDSKVLSCTENDFHSVKGLIASGLTIEEGIIDKADKVAVLVVK